MRLHNILSLTLLVCCLAAALPGWASTRQQQGAVLIRGDSELLLELLSPISTAANKQGDKFSCKVLEPDKLGGAIVSGHISKAKSSGKGKGKSELLLKFDGVTLADGRSAGFNAQIKEVYDAVNVGDEGRADSEGTVKGKSRIKISVKRAVIGSLIGAAIGGAVGGGKGAAAGAAIGASVGVSTALASEGPNLEFKQGTQFRVVTNGPSRLEGIR